MEAQDRVEGLWVQSEFFIEDGWIKEKPGDFCVYNPFDYHEAKSGQSLYLEFINLDENDERQILDFVNAYGVLGLELRKLGKTAFNIVWERSLPDKCPKSEGKKLLAEDVSDFRAQIRKLRLLVNLTIDLKQGNIKEELLERLQSDLPPRSCDSVNHALTAASLLLHRAKIKSIEEKKELNEAKKELAEAEKELAKAKKKPAEAEALTVSVSQRLSRVRELNVHKHGVDFSDANGALYQILIVHFNEELKRANVMFPTATPWTIEDEPSFALGLACDDLLSSMYTMAALDLNSSGLTPRICHNEPCDSVFMPKESRQIYCSNDCANAQKQREYRRRLKARENQKSAVKSLEKR